MVEEFIKIYTADTITATETKLVPVTQLDHPFDFYVQSIAGQGDDDNLQRIRATLPALWSNQSIDIVPPYGFLGVGRMKEVKLPVQMKVRANSELEIFATQDAGVNERLTVAVRCSKGLMPNKPTGLMYSQRFTGNTGDKVMVDAAVQKLPALNATKHTLMGMLIHGVSNVDVWAGSIRADGWATPTVNNQFNDPAVVAQRDVGQETFIQPVLANKYSLEDSDTYIPSAIGDGAQAYIGYTYWHAEGVIIG